MYGTNKSGVNVKSDVYYKVVGHPYIKMDHSYISDQYPIIIAKYLNIINIVCHVGHL